MLYIIAGTSLSGKTTARHFISKKYGFGGIDTDTLRTMTNVLLPEKEVGHLLSPKENYKNMRVIIDAFVHSRSFFVDDDFVLEGDCINITDLKSYIQAGTAKGVVVGYPNATPDDVLLKLSHTPLSHWSRKIDPATLRQKIDDFIEFSRFLEKEAVSAGIYYIDVGGLNVGQVNEAVHNYLFSS